MPRRKTKSIIDKIERELITTEDTINNTEKQLLRFGFTANNTDKLQKTEIYAERRNRINTVLHQLNFKYDELKKLLNLLKTAKTCISDKDAYMHKSNHTSSSVGNCTDLTFETHESVGTGQYGNVYKTYMLPKAHIPKYVRLVKRTHNEEEHILTNIEIFLDSSTLDKFKHVVDMKICNGLLNMEFLDDFKTYMKTLRTFDDKMTLIKNVVAAFEHFSNICNFIHFDIKPENLAVTKDTKTVKFIDMDNCLPKDDKYITEQTTHNGGSESQNSIEHMFKEFHAQQNVQQNTEPNRMLNDNKKYYYGGKLINFTGGTKEYNIPKRSFYENILLRNPNATDTPDIINVKTNIDKWGIGCVIYEIVFDKRLYDELIIFKYGTTKRTESSDMSIYDINTSKKDVQQFIDEHDIKSTELKTLLNKYLIDAMSLEHLITGLSGGSPNITIKRNPMDYHVRKYLQSGGTLKKNIDIKQFVKKTLKLHSGLEKRVIKYYRENFKHNL